MIAIQVGKLLRAGQTVWPETYQYSYDVSGHELLLCVRGLRQREIEGVTAGQARFGLSVVENIIFFHFEFAGAFDWSECPYSWHLVHPQNRKLPDLHFAPDIGAALRIILVEATTGIVAGLRVCSLSHRFSKRLHRAIVDQSQMEHDQVAYEALLRQTYQRYDSKQLLKRFGLARCVAGEIEPDERPPHSYRN